MQVFRRGAEAVHITDSELTEGEEVKCNIDWTRRFDHMQQHSGTLTTSNNVRCEEKGSYITSL